MKTGIISFICGIIATLLSQYAFPEYTTINSCGSASDSTSVVDSTKADVVVAAFPAATSIDSNVVKNDSVAAAK